MQLRNYRLVINGGTTDDGQKITPIQISTDTHIVEYYYTYALVLAHLNRCGEALQIAQLIQSRVPSDDIAMTMPRPPFRFARRISHRLLRRLLATLRKENPHLLRPL